MTTEHETSAAELGAPEPECERCGKALPLCICDTVEPIASRIQLLILQHPQEQERALGTARLTAQHFKNAVVR
ncbi:DTW domain-containing protein, partial [Rhodopseudomonas sp. BR0C11]|uniref:DTW domain-containing protein n=1 Tax=Rhodopseudomonas sp. BR0C11 TaxID=2269370 RepID=UPI0013DFD5D4